MNTVIYTNDLEPITVVRLEPSVLEYLQRMGQVTIAIPEPINYTNENQGNFSVPRYVRLTAHKLRHIGFADKNYITNHWIITTYDEESALLMKSIFLPGQTGAVNQVKSEYYAKGFMSAISRMVG